MTLLLWYLALVAAGDVLAYLVGLFIERQWGSYASLIVFLAMYFAVLYVAWVLSVRITKPREAAV